MTKTIPINNKINPMIIAIIDLILSPPGALIILVNPGKNMESIPTNTTSPPTIMSM